MSNQLYTNKCPRCRKIFRTDNPEQQICSDCLKHGQPHHKSRKKKTKPKILTFAEILHIAEVYNKVHHRYLHYGDVESFVNLNPNKCICCGSYINSGNGICSKCENK